MILLKVMLLHTYDIEHTNSYKICPTDNIIVYVSSYVGCIQSLLSVVVVVMSVVAIF